MSDILTKIKRLILYIGDILLLYLSLLFVLAIRYYDTFDLHLWQIHFWPFTVLFILWLLSFYISGLYDPKQTKNDIFFYTLIFRTLLVAGVMGMVYFYIYRSIFRFRDFHKSFSNFFHRFIVARFNLHKTYFSNIFFFDSYFFFIINCSQYKISTYLTKP